MISPAEASFIQDHAYIPEHIPGYGSVMSGGEPHLVEDFLMYFAPGTLVFIGYPLREKFDENRLQKILAATIQQFTPDQAVLIAPAIPSPVGTRGRSDVYYRLDLVHIQTSSKVNNMIQRAGREARVEAGRSLGAEHRRLIADFLTAPNLEEGSRHIFQNIPEYISSVATAEIFSARDASGNLVAFDIADFGSKEYIFYLFNFRSRHHRVPGASDLLIHAIIQEGRARQKIALNMGLGINTGVAFFKKKWGALPFLNHESVRFPVKSPSLLESFFEGLIKG